MFFRGELRFLLHVFLVVCVISLCGLPRPDFETDHYLGRSRVNDERFVFWEFHEVVLAPSFISHNNSRHHISDFPYTCTCIAWQAQQTLSKPNTPGQELQKIIINFQFTVWIGRCGGLVVHNTNSLNTLLCCPNKRGQGLRKLRPNSNVTFGRVYFS